MSRCNDLNALYSFHTPSNTQILEPFPLSPRSRRGKEILYMFSWLTPKELINPQRDAVRSKTGLFVVEHESLEPTGNDSGWKLYDFSFPTD